MCPGIWVSLLGRVDISFVDGGSAEVSPGASPGIENHRKIMTMINAPATATRLCMRMLRFVAIELPSIDTPRIAAWADNVPRFFS